MRIVSLPITTAQMGGFVLQILSSKLGIATGRHLAEHVRDRFPKVVRYVLWIMIELAVIGSDIQEVGNEHGGIWRFCLTTYTYHHSYHHPNPQDCGHGAGY